jgi:hypothetical protein
MKLLNESPSTDWMTPPPGSNYDGYIQFGCWLSKLSDEEMEEIKIEWMAEMKEDSEYESTKNYINNRLRTFCSSMDSNGHFCKS